MSGDPVKILLTNPLDLDIPSEQEGASSNTGHSRRRMSSRICPTAREEIRHPSLGKSVHKRLESTTPQLRKCPPPGI
jgi:hypothetical protein